MNLWIRSQDKRILVEVDEVYLNANYNNKVICYERNRESVNLGRYKSKERALEILDEIHNMDIENNPNFMVNEYRHKPIRVVYTMPQD